MTPWVMRLLIANIAMFFLQQSLGPQFTNALLFSPAYVLFRPWTLVTYMFLHSPAGFGHIFFNMLSLFFFGPRVENRIGSARFIQLYLWSGIAGALLSFALAFQSSILGASGAVFGVMLAFAYYWPGERILIWGVLPVEARVLVTVTTLFAVFGGFTGAQGGVAHFAHLGGYAGAWVYLRLMERYTGTRQFRQKAVPKIAQGALVNWQRIDPLTVHEANRGELVRVLDKANRSGLPSLTPQERAFLINFLPREA